MPILQDPLQTPLMRKLEEMRQRYRSLQASMNDPAVQANSQKLVAASKEAGQLEPIVKKFERYRASLKTILELQEMAGNPADAEMAKLAALELPAIQAQAAELLDLLTDEFIAAEDNAVTSFSWRFGPAPAERRRRCSPAISTRCTANTANPKGIAST